MLLEKGRCLRVAEWCQAGHRLLGIEPACEEGGLTVFRRRRRGYLAHDGRRLRVRRLVVAHASRRGARRCARSVPHAKDPPNLSREGVRGEVWSGVVGERRGEVWLE